MSSSTCHWGLVLFCAYLCLFEGSLWRLHLGECELEASVAVYHNSETEKNMSQIWSDASNPQAEALNPQIQFRKPDGFAEWVRLRCWDDQQRQVPFPKALSWALVPWRSARLLGDMVRPRAVQKQKQRQCEMSCFVCFLCLKILQCPHAVFSRKAL